MNAGVKRPRSGANRGPRASGAEGISLQTRRSAPRASSTGVNSGLSNVCPFTDWTGERRMAPIPAPGERPAT